MTGHELQQRSPDLQLQWGANDRRSMLQWQIVVFFWFFCTRGKEIQRIQDQTSQSGGPLWRRSSTWSNASGPEEALILDSFFVFLSRSLLFILLESVSIPYILHISSIFTLIFQPRIVGGPNMSVSHTVHNWSYPQLGKLPSSMILVESVHI